MISCKKSNEALDAALAVKLLQQECCIQWHIVNASKITVIINNTLTIVEFIIS